MIKRNSMNLRMTERGPDHCPQQAEGNNMDNISSNWPGWQLPGSSYRTK
jgi:hypothetical protein